MRRALIMAGLLVGSLTVLGLAEPALAWDGVACDHSPGSAMGTMGGPTEPGMMGYSPGRGSAMGGHMGFFDRPITIMLNLKHELKLTAEQTAKLESLRGSFQKKAEEGFRTLQPQYGELAKILDADKVDVARAEATLKGIATRETDLALERIRVIEEGKSVSPIPQTSIGETER